MCGRYAILEGEGKKAYDQAMRHARDMAALAIRRLKGQANYDVRPTQRAPVVLWDGHDLATVDARWGWQRDFAGGGRIINARWETAALKPTFAQAVRCRRCVVPASAYYEWRRDTEDRPLEKYAFRPSDGSWFCMAGLHEEAGLPDGVEHRFLVLTRPMTKHATIHDRTPVMLADDAARAWLDPGASQEVVRAAAQSMGDDDLVVRPVCAGPNKARPAGPHLLASTGDPWPW
jgi:putative SOS response-associated peptidase YedK